MALLSILNSISFSSTIFSISAALIGWVIVSYLSSPLRRYPGPFLAGWTNLWRLWLAHTGNYHTVIKQLHEKYGPVVRIGPNTLDLDYPELLTTIYGTDNKWHKMSALTQYTLTEFYHSNSTKVDGKLTFHMFSTSDPAEHSRMKKPIAKYFTLNSVLQLEAGMDKIIDNFCHHLEKQFHTAECDLTDWLSFCAWDMISQSTFSRRYGYMDHGHDFDRSITIAEQSVYYFAIVGQMPFLDFLLDKNPIIRLGPPNLEVPSHIAWESLIARLEGVDKNFSPDSPDFLQHFIDSREHHPELVDLRTIMGYLIVNVVAGADTTAVVIKALLYYILTHPDAYQKLEAEILGSGWGNAEKPTPYSVARAMPYLEASVRETMRLQPSQRMLLERYVPPPGLTLPDGSHVPAGVAVGLNPYVTGRNAIAWGPDPDAFRPERWMRAEKETEEVFQNRIKGMNNADISFGGGSRICIGRHWALMEVYKVVATLVGRFEIRLVDGGMGWNVSSYWFAKPSGLVCRLKRREAASGDM